MKSSLVYGSAVLEQGRAFIEAWWGRKGHVCGANLFGDKRRRAARRKESGGEKERATVGMAGRDAIPPSSGFFDGGRGKYGSFANPHETENTLLMPFFLF